ncbi:MAG: ribonuclease H-like domain-containing protein [Nanoarchaeota archaeon]
MLQSTFLHIPGIGKAKELSLWHNNMRTWDDAINGAIESSIKKHCLISKEQYESRNHWYFSESLPLSEHWRAYPDFKDSCCFLDIETTGLDKQNNKITTIGVYNGNHSRVFVRGQDLEEFTDYIKNYSMIVTFNGRCFDLPFIKTVFPFLDLSQLHIDLRFCLKELGLKGGLKMIEKQLGFARDDEISEVDGLEAVRLWKRYRKGEKAALQKLVAYNKADVENLMPLMEIAYARLKNNLLKTHNLNIS